MTSSGTYGFSISNASVVFEALDRIGIRPTQVEPHHLISARLSINLEMLAWSNKGFPLWEVISGTIPLVAGQAVYTLPANLVTLTELWYSQVNAGGTGVNQDRIMIPITRTHYASIVNKLQTGIPTQYLYQMLSTPQVTVWEVPAAGAVAPGTVLQWYGLSQPQDANLGGGETPDIAYKATDALISGLALRLAEKFGPTEPNARKALLLEKKAFADDAWDNMVRRDQEPGATTFRPEMSSYGRMSRR